MDISLREWIKWLIWADRGVAMDDVEQIIIAPLIVEGLVFIRDQIIHQM